MLEHAPRLKLEKGLAFPRSALGEKYGISLTFPHFFLVHSSCSLNSQHSDFSCALTGHGLWSALSRGSFWEELLPGVPVPQRRDLRLSDGSLPLQPRLHRGTVRKTHSCQPAEPGGLCYSRETSEAGRKNKESICDTVKSADFVGGMCAVSLS